MSIFSRLRSTFASLDKDLTDMEKDFEDMDRAVEEAFDTADAKSPVGVFEKETNTVETRPNGTVVKTQTIIRRLKKSR